ncbi:MAG: hypothetical protein HOE44_14135 [Candidatus Marinimicrobia bacterium]|nr:hypothetical protein [Candidatus Neomarinimicrobiota bacterium]
MAGFIQDPIQFVNLIADNLRDRYQTGFPILKELIQNTDDAPATELHYGLSPGLKNSSHPLLQGPGLFLINNGAFKSSDARGIRSFGQNSKAADQASIGKFGLGMKSVFHFCETFFFLAHDGQQAYAEVLNPWSGPDSMESLHRDWDDFTDQDAKLIRDTLSGITGKISKTPEQCFILWLPLRKKSHLELPNGNRAGAIVAEYPGDDRSLLDFLHEETLGVKIAALLPMLRSLQRASFWQVGDSGEVTKPVFEVSLGEGASRPSLIESAQTGDDPDVCHRNEIKGRIRIAADQGSQPLEFQGYEHYGWTPALTAMHAHELWPSSYVRDDLGHSREAKDKAQPHGAVFFSRTPGDGRLTANWSVFLPLDETHTSESIRVDGSHDFRLTLHGYFFIDAGRQGIHGLGEYEELRSIEPDSEEALRRAWNCELLDHAVLPLLLPALDSFCRELPLADKARSALSSALKEVTWVHRFRNQITANHCWIRALREDGTEWVLRGNVKDVLTLPSTPDADPSRPWRLFQSLRDIAANNWLAVVDAPNIVHPEKLSQWNEERLLSLLEGVDCRQLFSDAVLLDYFAKFLDQSAGPFLKTGMVNSQLGNIFKKGLMQNGEPVLGQNQQRVRDIVSHLDEERCFRIDDQLPDALIKRLLIIDIDSVLIPKRFYPSEWKGGVLSVNGAAQLLRKVQDALNADTAVNQEYRKAALNLSEQIIKGVELENRGVLLRRCADLEVLSAYNCKTNTSVAVSLNTLLKARENELVFGLSQGINPQDRLGLAPNFQKVLPKDSVLLVNAETAKLAFELRGAMPSCNGSNVLHALGNRSRTLGEENARAALARQLGTPKSEIEIRGLRFLLHANSEYFSRDDDALWILGEEQHPVWRKLWSQLVENEREPWNLIKGSIADSLARDVSRMIGIKEIRATDVIDDIRQRGFSIINTDVFDRDDCEQILGAIKEDDLWIAAPFHWTNREKPVCGNSEGVYLQDGNLSVDDALLQNVHLVLLSSNSQLELRQKQLLRPLDQNAHAQILLSSAHAACVWRGVLDALSDLENAGKQPSLDTQEKIKSVAWVPTLAGSQVAPDDIIYLETADAELERVLGQAPDTFTTHTNLSDEFKAHPFFFSVRDSYFATGQSGIERLALVVGDLKPYLLGAITIETAEELHQTAQFLSTYEHPGWRLLAKLNQNPENKLELLPLFRAMNTYMALTTLVDLMNWIANRGETSKEATHTFNLYLKAFSQAENAKESIGQLKLYTRDRKWRSSEELVSGVVGVSASRVLNAEQSEILSKIIFQERSSDKTQAEFSDSDASTNVDATAGILRDYFQAWVGRVPPALTAVLTLLFGRHESVKTLCQELLGQHSREWLISQMPWKVPDKVEAGGARCWLYGASLEEAIENFQMTVRVHSDDTITVRSILGQPIKVNLEEKYSNLLAGRPSYHRVDGVSGYRVDLVLRKTSIDECSDKQLSSYLQESTTYLLKEVFNQRHPGLDALWSELDKSDQVDIELARALILQNIPFYLKQLGAHKHSSLSEGISRYRDDERREKEFSGKPDEQKYKTAKERALVDLQRVIESDEAAQKAILESVRRKVLDFQYQPESIPFELFQNADDSLQDLELIDAYPANPGDLDVEPLPASICKFVVEANKDELVFVHWGRAINQFGSKGFPGREKGFDRDLENMLILSASDKGEAVTGKFGLGFKSVWLASERPTVVSGRLQAEIAGGLLPVPTQNSASKYLRKRMAELLNDNHWPGTGIHLPLSSSNENDLLAPFERVAGVLVAFSRKINTVEIKHHGGRTVSANWHGVALPGCSNAFVGHVRQHSGDFLVLKLELKDGDVIIPIGPNGFQELPKDVPNLWVTAPIKEQERIGYAINAMFEVDAGRSRLSANLEENEKLAGSIGHQLAAVLHSVHQALEGQWQAISEKMQFAPETDQYQFWNSLWRILFSRLPQLPRESGARVITTSMLQNGLHELATKNKTIPNGLPGKFKKCLSTGEVKIVLKDAMSRSDVFLTVANTSRFQSVLDTKNSITSEHATWLKIAIPEFASSTTQWKSINLTYLGNLLDKRKEISPSDASALGKVLNSSTLANWQAPEADTHADHIRDLKGFIEAAKELVFRTQEGASSKAKGLVTDRSGGDEALRWSFAPDTNRLAGAYSASATEFFLLCRDKLEAPTEKLKEWILLADDHSRRAAALKYLIQGELARQVTDLLHRDGISGTWLDGIEEDSDILSDWDTASRTKLVYQVLKSPDQIRRQWQTPFEPSVPIQKPINPSVALNNIYEWWGQARNQALKDYHADVYPEAHKINYLDDDTGSFDRSAWLVLLLLGGFHTMGRTMPSQHRRFIEDCQRRGWWDVFTDPIPSQRFEDWMGVLDQYIEQQVDQQSYEQWMMRFPIIYKLSRYLDDYAELFTGLERYKKPFDLPLVLTPLADSDQQGGGISAPPLWKTLGIGSNFIVRELLRNNVMDTPYLRKHAFVPYLGVRNLFSEMGCDTSDNVPRQKLSPLISKFIEENIDSEKATFYGDYDIPLRIVAEDWELQHSLLERELPEIEEYE